MTYLLKKYKIKCQCYHLGCDAMFLPSQEIYRSWRWKIYSIQIFVCGGRKLNKTENEREEK